jgi:hypothetical protein
MKKPLIFFCLLALSGCLFAQSNKEDVDIIQAALGKEKKALVASFVKLDAANSDAFWKLYDEYETSRKALGKKRIALLEKYANNYLKLDDATTDQMMKDTQALQVDNDKLIVQYYGKLKKSAGVKPAAQFYQLEGYFLSLIRTKILEGIPLIGEFDGKP